MDTSDPQEESKPESAADGAQIEGEKHEGVCKKLWHGKKQIYEKLQSQMEFYFSNSNLAKDRFMSKLTQEDQCKTLKGCKTFSYSFAE